MIIRTKLGINLSGLSLSIVTILPLGFLLRIVVNNSMMRYSAYVNLV